MLRNLKHILFIVLVSAGLVFWSVFLFGKEFSSAINGFFTYRTGGGVWQDKIYEHTLRPSNDIAIIKIDNDSLNALQAKWNLKVLTIPKENYITLIENLQSYGVKWIAFDIIFENADKDEDLFAKTLKKYKNVVIGSEFKGELCAGRLEKFVSVSRQKVEDNSRVAATLDLLWLVNIGETVDESACPEIFYKIIQGNKELLTPSEKTAYKEILESKMWDDSFTETLVCERDANKKYTNCSGAPRSVYKDIVWGIVNTESKAGFERTVYENFDDLPYASWKLWTGVVQVDSIKTKLFTLPIALQIATENMSRSTIEFQRFSSLNPYFGPPGSYPSISLSDALTMDIALMKSFSGKYVFVGESGTAIHDSITSPVTNTQMDGVEMHAHYLDGILQDKMLFRVTPEIQTGLIIVSIIVSIFLYYMFPSFLALILAILLPIGVIYAARYSYDVDRVLVDIFPLLLWVSILTYPITYIYKFFIVDREKRQLKANFSHYIDPHVVDQIAKKWVSIELGGERKNLTVLFSDIAGFTTISEKLDPRDLFYLMTAYLSNMTDILIKEGWTLDKYIGDAVMGFFGAPLSYEDHGIRAANTALLMRQALPDFNKELEKHGIDPIDFRVGIASWDVLVGNIWSHDRFNYTVLGDTVNLASRLEAAGKEYGVNILISGKVKESLTPHYFVRELDTLAVKWKTEGVTIYELLGYSEDFVDRLIYINYEKALRLYRNDQYKEAGQIWQTQALHDTPSRIMMLRCVAVLKWEITIRNGIYVMDHK
jgi:class 3 adenylate cyclase/CHASE2 domain-containing sensor protein